VFALLLAASARVVAQPDLVAGALETIADERSRAVDPRVPATDRLASAERLLDLRGRLLAERPDDPRRVVWLADQATDLLLVLLPINSSGLTSLFGLPSPDQRARAERVGRQMSALAAEAELEIERSILALESAPGYADDIAARMKRRRLTEGERDRRIPFVRGVGACLAAALDGSAPQEKEAAYRLAAERLQTTLPLLTGRPANLARLYAGLALRGLGDYEAADAVLDAPAPAPRADPVDVFAIRMTRVTISAARAGTTAGLDALSAMEGSYLRADDLLFRVLIADQRFLLHRDAARQTDGAPRQRHLVEAYEALLDLLDTLPDPDSQVNRVIVLDRLTRAADADAPLDQLPAIVSVARARQLGAQPDTRAQAIALFNRLLAREDLPRAARAEAHHGLARTLLADEQLLAAAQRFSQLARDHPTARTAERAVVLAATLAAELYRRVPGDAEAALLRSTLDLLLDRYPNLVSIDRWRLIAATLSVTERRFERAVILFEQVPPNAGQWLDAQIGRAGALRSWAKDNGDADVAARRWQDVLDAADAVDPAVRRALAVTVDAGQAQDLQDDQAVLAVYRAEARLALGDPSGALEALRDVGDDRTVSADAVLTRIDAYAALGRSDEVEQELGRLLAVAGPRAGDILAGMLAARRETPDAQRDLVPVARALARWLITAGDDVRDRARLELAAADAYRQAERWREALGLYDGLLSRHPNAVEVLLGRAECLFALGDDHLADAMELYKRISRATGGRGGDEYWQSQLRMLQILSRTDRNTQRIAPHIQRLRQKDPELGGERFRREFERLQAQHS
jgi:tetratricopeptide (TPR) repeat protein